jgi:O-antigen ligase
MTHRLNSFIFYTLLALIVLTAIPYGTVQPGWEAIFECVVFTLGSLWILEALLRGEWQLRGLRLLVPLAAIIVLAFIQTLPLLNPGHGGAGAEGYALRTISADPYETWLFVLKTSAIVLAGELLWCYTSSRRRLRLLVTVVIGVGVGSAVFGIARQTMQGDAPGFVLPSLAPGVGYGQFINRNHFAFLMEMTLGLVLGLVVGGGVPRDRILVYLSAGIAIWNALVLSNSRGGIFGMCGQIIFMVVLFGLLPRKERDVIGGDAAASRLWRISRSVPVRVLLVACLLVTLVAGVVLVGGDPLASRLETIPGEVSVGHGLDADEAETRENVKRLDIWRATWLLIKAHPVAGVGFGGYWAAIPEYHDASGVLTPQQAHNDYLELLASGGPLAVVLAAWFAVELIRCARRQLGSSDALRRAACFGALTGLSAVAIHSFVDFGLHITANGLVCAALVVLAAAELPADPTPGEVGS